MLITGTVIAVQIIGAADPLPRTSVQLQTDQGTRVDFVLPGANGGPPAAVWGVPTVQVNQRWTVDLIQAGAGLVPRGLGAGMSTPQPRWNINGNHLRDAALPWPVHMNNAGVNTLGADRTEIAVQAALDQWSDVGCSTFAFSYQGRTALGVAEDGENVLAWEEDSWDWGDQVAGMNITRFGLDGDDIYVTEVDILFNAVDFTWVDIAQASGTTLNIGAIATHELGHMTGMDHEYDLLTSTMYLAYYGGNWGATLSGDDHRGLCENYPTGADSCVTDEDCDAGRRCIDIDGIKVCDERRAASGDPCSLMDYNCERACAITNVSWTEGLCALPCDDELSCEPGFHCEEFARTMPLDAGPLCVADEADTAETPDTAEPATDTASPSANTPESGCGCHHEPRAPWLALPLLLIPLTRRTHPCSSR